MSHNLQISFFSFYKWKYVFVRLNILILIFDPILDRVLTAFVDYFQLRVWRNKEEK